MQFPDNRPSNRERFEPPQLLRMSTLTQGKQPPVQEPPVVRPPKKDPTPDEPPRREPPNPTPPTKEPPEPPDDKPPAREPPLEESEINMSITMDRHTVEIGQWYCEGRGERGLKLARDAAVLLPF